MSIKTHILVVAAGPLLALLALTTQPLLGRSLKEAPIIEQPAYWVPFSARIKRVMETDGSVFVGRYYRGIDGSTRSETGPSFEEVTSIGIKNVSLQEFYLWSQVRGWTRQPMDLPPWGWVPLEKAWNDRLVAVDEKVEGFTVIAQSSADRVHYLAPALNFFSLKDESHCAWSRQAQCGRWVYDVSLDPPPDAYFLPPTGVPIEDIAEAGGIVLRKGPSGE
jgi:hypothetical protein